MKTKDIIKGAVVAPAVLGCCVPQVVLAAGPVVGPSAVVADVAQAQGGVLQGQVVDVQGTPVAGTQVAVWSADQQVGSVLTDEDGRFAAAGLEGGVYQLAAADGQAVYRLWTPGTAPPSAQQGALVVAGGLTVRGAGGAKMLLTNPWVWGGIVITAITVPVAMNNARSKSP